MFLETLITLCHQRFLAIQYLEPLLYLIAKALEVKVTSGLSTVERPKSTLPDSFFVLPPQVQLK